MPKVGDMFPSAFLKAGDLGSARPVLRIRTVGFEEIGDERKPVVYFEGKTKGLVLNKTNAGSIVEIAGTDDTDHWVGVAIRLYSAMTDFQGKRVPCIRVEMPPPGVNTPVPPTPPPVTDADDVPF
jgi:hypothetical protein